MAYATPTLIIQRFGLDEITGYLDDEQPLLTSQLLLDAIAGTWTGTPSDAEKAAATDALARLTRQLQVTSNTMDGYLRSAVTLPLSDDDANAGTLEDCCMALARCSLADDTDNATDRMDKCCADWRTWLRDVAKGTVQLVGASGNAPPTSRIITSGQAASAINWGNFNNPGCTVASPGCQPDCLDTTP